MTEVVLFFCCVCSCSCFVRAGKISLFAVNATLCNHSVLVATCDLGKMGLGLLLCCAPLTDWTSYENKMGRTTDFEGKKVSQNKSKMLT